MKNFLRTYAVNGSVIWTREFDASQFSGLVVSPDGDAIFMAGAIDGALPGQVPAGGTDVFVREYNPNGIVQ